MQRLRKISVLILLALTLLNGCRTWNCSSNEYGSGGLCIKCSLNCKSCIGQNYNCTTCNTGYFLNATRCLTCPYKCKTCDGNGKCLECLDGATPSEDAANPCGDPSANDIPIRNACFYALITAVGLTFLYLLWDWFGCDGKSNQVTAAKPETREMMSIAQEPKYIKAELYQTAEAKPKTPIPSMNFASVQLGDSINSQPPGKIEGFVSRVQNKGKLQPGKPEILNRKGSASPQNSQKSNPVK